jgi:hypothetical protein
VACFALQAAALTHADAQELYGSIVGTVQDAAGARIPGATIAVLNRDTNLVLATVTNETGAYALTNLRAEF